MTRTITTAAIRRKDGTVYTGRRHHEIINSHPKGFFSWMGGSIQGFVTSDGEFVTREEAAKIAFACGQIKESK